MPRRPGSGPRGYDKFKERLNKTQADLERERIENRRREEERQRQEGYEFLMLRDREIREAQVGMSPWQREQMEKNTRGFLAQWGIRDRRTTSVPSADDRLDKLREEAIKKAEDERRQADLIRQRQQTEEAARREAVRIQAEVELRDSLLRSDRIRAQIAIERAILNPDDYR